MYKHFTKLEATINLLIGSYMYVLHKSSVLTVAMFSVHFVMKSHRPNISSTRGNNRRFVQLSIYR